MRQKRGKFAKTLHGSERIEPKIEVFSTRYPDLLLHLQLTPFEKKNGTGSLQEALDWKKTLLLDKIQILYVYGLCGYYATVLMDWLKQDAGRHLIFLEDDLGALDAFSLMPAAKAILDHPQIHLRWAASPQEWDILLENCASEFSFDKIEVSASKAYKKLPRFRKIKLSLLRKTVLWSALTNETILGHLLHDNIIPNLRRIPRCSYVNHWKDALKNVPIIICGAGPSLKTVADELRKMRDRALIIACGSALSALSHLKIRPHLGIAIDPNERELHCLSGCSYRDLPLLFGSRLYPKVFELFDGPYGYIRSGTGGPLESYVENALGLDDPFVGYDLGREALSVTTLAVSLANAWGCNPIIFAGVDMAYAREKHYAEGVPVKAQLNLQDKRSGEQMVRRKGAEGHLVTTLIKWIMEQGTIDRFAKNHSQTTFLNANPGGLGFKHIPYKPFQEIITCAPCDYDKKIAQLLQQTKMKKTSAEVEKTLATLSSSLGRCLKLFQLLQQEEPGSGKSVLYQTDLDLEVAYQLVLGSSKIALDRMGLKRDAHVVPDLMEAQKWKFLEEAAQSYLKALK
ncbi:MAG TPA: 6-hydroxymethylpterin diphosphokinase MptE-like protein [Rhabdochlamydiaceae bacterium]|nr:6-hydroxymethylpterin diphosphokinase MptE-like protein [Rhabdochlamydiaceae bacterium]